MTVTDLAAPPGRRVAGFLEHIMRRVVGSPWTVEAVASALLALAVFVAATPALDAYRVAVSAAVVAVSAGGSVLAAFCGARLLRLGPVGSYGLSVAGLIVLLLAADGAHPSGVIRSIADGPSRILTETLPLSGSRTVISALVVLVWICGAATGEILLRTAGRPWVSCSLAVPVLLYITCYAAASSAPGHRRYAGPVLLVCLALAAALVHVRARPATQAPATEPAEEARTRRRAVITAIVVPVAAAALFSGLAPTVPGLGRSSAVLHRGPPTAAPFITDPLDSMALLRDGNPHAAPAPELSVMLSRPSTGYLGMGYLDVYDGGQWRFSADFQPTGGRVPAALSGVPALVSQDQVRQRIDIIGALPVPLLPALDRPDSVTGLQVVADPVTGMLLPQSPAARTDYTVLSSVPDDSLPGLSPADGIDQSQAGSDLELPGGTSTYLATTVRFLATLTGQHPTGAVGFLQQALGALRGADKRVDPTATPSAPAAPSKPPARAAPGHRPPAPTTTTTTTVPPSGGGGTSLSEVINAVTVQRAGTPEQFATFFALVARYLGVPARVVTGFRLVGDSSGQPIPAGSYRVTNREAWAWVEIPVQGFGWVVCDPTPDATTAGATTPPEAVSAPATTVPPRQANAVPRNQSTGGHALAPPGHIRVRRSSHLSNWALAGSALCGLLVLIFAAGPGQAALRRHIRRRRRRSEDPVLLAIGAWLELLDGLDRAGMRSPAGATASEVAEEVGHHFGADLVLAAARVAATADRAVFSTASPVPAEMATEAWSTSRDLCRQVLGTLDPRHRIRSTWTVGSAPSRPSGHGR